MQSILTIQSWSRDRSRSRSLAKGEEWERGVEHVGYINSHSRPTLNLILSPDPDPEQSGLVKGGGGREGWNMWIIFNSHTTSLSTTLNLILSPEPLQRTSSCAEIKQKKCLNIRISKDQ